MSLPAHSPLGGSTMARAIECPGSVTLGYGVQEPGDEDYRTEGVAAHTVAANCLIRNVDAWTYIGAVASDDKIYVGGDNPSRFPGAMVGSEMANAVQLYLDAVRQAHPDRNQGNFWVERRFHCPSIHKYFYGTADAVWLSDSLDYLGGGKVLHVWDYKHGAGIVVEAKENVQCMYYACGALEDLMLWDDVDEVVLHIAQPRAFHQDGAFREWRIKTYQLLNWLEDILIPAMDRALVSRETKTGEHCRFCPVRFRACPGLVADMNELEELVEEFENADPARQYTGPEIGRLLELVDRSKIVAKAAGKLAFHMLQHDAKSVPGQKLVKAKSDRTWKEGAEAELKRKFKGRAYTKPKLLSPAQIENLPGGDKVVAEWAFKPDKGLTIAPDRDQRGAVDKSVKHLFKPVKGR